MDYLDLLGTDNERDAFWKAYPSEEHKRAFSEVRHHQYFHLNDDEPKNEEDKVDAKQEA